jgi:hypothetical protein
MDLKGSHKPHHPEVRVGVATLLAMCWGQGRAKAASPKLYCSGSRPNAALLSPSCQRCSGAASSPGAAARAALSALRQHPAGRGRQGMLRRAGKRAGKVQLDWHRRGEAGLRKGKASLKALVVSGPG